MNDFERLKLQEMIKTNDVEDQTNKIRKLKDVRNKWESQNINAHV